VQPAEIQALSFNFSIGDEKPQRLASLMEMEKRSTVLEGTFPHILSKAREVGRVARSRVPAFATKTLG
jgi:hypothetical protein